ncbi:MAG: MFS transporter [Pseudomonadota bacterium]
MRFEPRYWVVIGAVLTQFTAIGILIAYGQFVKIFEAEFGWSRTVVSTSSSAAFVMMGVYAMIAGPLNDRYGPKIVMGISSIMFGLGVMLISQVSEPWHLYLVMGVLVAAGLSTHDVVTLSTIARWFEKRRGQMTGVAKVGTALGQMAVPPILAALVLAIGWRETVLIVGATAGVILFVAAIMMRMPPRPADQSGTTPPPGSTFAEARRSTVFWRICTMQFLFFATLSTVPFHIQAHGTDLGLSQGTAALLVTMMGAASILGRLTVGLSADRLGGRRAYLICFSVVLASLAGLIAVDVAWALFTVMAVYGFGHGGLFTVVSPTIAEFFGMRAHGAIFGVVLFSGTIGGAVFPIVAGWMFDTQGTYFWAFLLLAGMIVLAMALALSLPDRSSEA